MRWSLYYELAVIHPAKKVQSNLLLVFSFVGWRKLYKICQFLSDLDTYKNDHVIFMFVCTCSSMLVSILVILCIY